MNRRSSPWQTGLRQFMDHGARPAMRALFGHVMPSSRRCKGCLLPFHGPFSIPFRLAQLGPSRKNPNICTL